MTNTTAMKTRNPPPVLSPSSLSAVSSVPAPFSLLKKKVVGLSNEHGLVDEQLAEPAGVGQGHEADGDAQAALPASPGQAVTGLDMSLSGPEPMIALAPAGSTGAWSEPAARGAAMEMTGSAGIASSTAVHVWLAGLAAQGVVTSRAMSRDRLVPVQRDEAQDGPSGAHGSDISAAPSPALPGLSAGGGSEQPPATDMPGVVPDPGEVGPPLAGGGSSSGSAGDGQPPVQPDPMPRPQPPETTEPVPAPKPGDIPPTPVPGTETQPPALTPPPVAPDAGQQPPMPQPLPEPLPQPEYPKEPASASIAHNGEITFGSGIFTGTSLKNTPAFIRIEAIEPLGEQSGAAAALRLDKADGGAITVGQVIKAEDFGKIIWNALGNQGGQFRFRPLDEQQQPIAGVEVQTVQVAEHPLPPAYPQNQAPQPVEHDGLLAFSRITFAGTDHARMPEAVRIVGIVEQGKVPGSPSPLSLQQENGHRLPLTEGSVIGKDDFARIIWDASQNDGGSFDFLPLTAGGDPIAGAEAQHVGIDEHPMPPLYPPQAEVQQVAHDGLKPIDARVLGGLEPDRQPAAIRITAVTPADPADTDAAALVFGPNRARVEAGWLIRADDFDQLAWDSSHNAGGSFSFVAANADGTELLGANPQQVEIVEHPVPPDYVAQTAPLWVSHDADLVVEEAWIAGNRAEHRPAAIRITAIEPAGDGSVLEQALSVAKPGVDSRPLTVGSRVESDEFGSITWHAGHNQGGRFSFEAINADGSRILGSEVQTLAIREHAAIPDYPAASRLLVAHDATQTIGAEVFRGGTEAKAPPAVRIVSAPAGALQHENGRAVADGELIAADDFGKLRWHAQATDGGSLRFVPVNGDGTPIPGAAEQVLTVDEAPPPPIYSQANDPLSVVQDGVLKLSDRLFTGTDDSRKPEAIRIEAVDAAGLDPSAPLPLKLDEDGAGGEAPVSVTLNQTIAAEHFDRLSWDASSNTGGSFRFVPVRADGSTLPGASAQTITIEESSTPAPVYPADPTGKRPEVGVAHDQTRLLPAELFAGKDLANAPEYIRISWDEESYIVTPLKMRMGSWDRTLSQNEIIHKDDFGKIVWDASRNSGGTIIFDALDGNRQPLGGVDTQYITVYESMKFPHYRSLYEDNHRLTKNPNGEDIPYGASWGIFLGTGFHKRPLAYTVRIDSIVEEGDTNPGVSAMRLIAHDGKPEREVKPGDIIERDDLESLVWRSSETTGGSFTFTPLDYLKRVIEGGYQITLQVVESAPDPDYGRITQEFSGFRGESMWGKFDGHMYQNVSVIPFKSLVKLDKEFFAGRNEDATPHAIRIVSVGEMDPVENSTGGLSIRRDNGEVILLKNGDVVQADDLDRLYVDTRFNAGVSLHFYPMDAKGGGVVNGRNAYIEVVQTFREGDPPMTTGTVDRPVVAYNRETMIDPEVFYSFLPRDSAHNRVGYRILSYTEKVDESRTLYLYTLYQEGTTAYEVVRVPEGISKAEAESRAQAAGGTLLSIDDDKERNWLDGQVFKVEGLAEDLVMHAQSSGQSLNAFVIERANHSNPLVYYGEWHGWEAAPRADSGIGKSQIERMGWNSANNMGGSITIGQLADPHRYDGDVRPETVRTIHLTEAPRPAADPADPAAASSQSDAPASSPAGKSVVDSPEPITLGMLAGRVDEVTLIPASTASEEEEKDDAEAEATVTSVSLLAPGGAASLIDVSLFSEEPHRLLLL